MRDSSKQKKHLLIDFFGDGTFKGVVRVKNLAFYQLQSYISSLLALHSLSFAQSNKTSRDLIVIAAEL